MKGPLILSDSQFRALIQNSSDIITVLDSDGTVRYESPSVEKIVGYKPEELIGKNIFEYIHPDDVDEVVFQFNKVYQETEISHKATFRFKHKNGTWRFLDVTGTNLLSHHAISGIVINSRDVTEQKKIEGQLRYNAYHDVLTNLPNRNQFQAWLEYSFVKLTRQPKYKFAVLFLDLDRFKIINDSLGHAVGDQVLVNLSFRLKDCLREIDKVARFGGDEFSILVEDINEVHEVIQIADRIQEELVKPFYINERELFCSASIGIAISNVGYQQPSDILRDADIALYQAKERGKTRYEIFNIDMRNQAIKFLKLETDLRRAIENSEFSIYYQPIVSLITGEIKCIEALIRWHKPKEGFISPEIFIPVAEETGLINTIGDWGLREACLQMIQWDSQFINNSQISLGFNLSVKQFSQPNLINKIDRILIETKLHPSRLNLEITESVLIKNSDTATSIFSQLTAMQIKLSMDDFGTGYSALSYLHRFPISSLKIDRSFVSHMKQNDKNFEIIRAILSLSSSLGIEVIAEGIETQEQMRCLQKLNCGYGQGYFFSTPLSAEEMKSLISRNIYFDKIRSSQYLGFSFESKES